MADASAVAVHGKAYLRFDSELRADLNELLHSHSPPSPAQASELIKAAYGLSEVRSTDELNRMPPEGLRWLCAHYQVHGVDGESDVLRTALKQRYREESAPRLEKDTAQLWNPSETRRFLLAIHRRLEPPPGDRGRILRALLAAPFFIPAVVGAEIVDSQATQRPLVADFEQAIEYHPSTDPRSEPATDLTSLDFPQLAARYAPVLVQQVQPAASFDQNADRIGRVFLTGEAARIDVGIDTTHPVLYWAFSQARVGDRRYDQLTYVMWYPSRPALTSGDVQAGDIDGVIIRITLDCHRRPAVYEFARTCGCYHTLWAAEFLEAATRREFGTPAGDRRFAIQRDTKGRSLFVAGLVDDDGSRPARPVVFINSGEHLVVGIRPWNRESEASRSVEQKIYVLEAYDSLTHLPLGDSVASMFGSDGLVHNAGRKEGFLMAPTGMLSAGQPRQLGTVKIRMDAYDQDDPRLLEECLLFPSGF